jgi:hypothetical protein
MSLKDKLRQVVEGARKLRQSRDPNSYSHYEHDRDEARRHAEGERQAHVDSAERVRENEERTHGFEERYAAEHEQNVERERSKRDDGS